MQDPDGVRKEWSASKWEAFEKQCVSEFKFMPAKDDPMHAADILATGGGRWSEVWRNDSDLWYRYAAVTELLLRVSPPKKSTLFYGPQRYPALNDGEEDALRRELLSLRNIPEAKAAETVLELEGEHGSRRNFL